MTALNAAGRLRVYCADEDCCMKLRGRNLSMHNRSEQWLLERTADCGVYKSSMRKLQLLAHGWEFVFHPNYLSIA